MKPPSREKRLPPKRENSIRFQVNPIFADEAEMNEWVNKNIPGAKIVKTWTVTRIACEVESKIPRGSLITIKKTRK